MLFGMLSLLWLYSSCANCHGACVEERDWMMRQRVVGGSNGGGRFQSLLNIVRLCAWKPFWRVRLHIVGMGLKNY